MRAAQEEARVTLYHANLKTARHALTIEQRAKLPFASLHLTSRTVTTLTRDGMLCYDHLATKSLKEMNRIRAFGVKSLIELERTIALLGLPIPWEKARPMFVAGDGPEPKGFWQHYTGVVYEVLTVASCLPDGVRTVIYRDTEEKAWGMPIRLWNEYVAMGRLKPAGRKA